MDGLHSLNNERSKMLYSNCGPNCRYCKINLACDYCDSGHEIIVNFPYCCKSRIPSLPGFKRYLHEFDAGERACSLHCPFKTYTNNDTCSSCIENCDICDDTEHCLQCSEPYYRKDYKCVSDCGDGYYSEYIYINSFETIRMCERCPQYCKICDSANSCKVCSEGYKLKEDYCVEDCGDGFYESEGVCHRCREGCLRCSDSQNCLECNSPNKLIIGNNYRFCKISKSKRKNNRSLLTLLYIITHSKNS